MGQGIGVSVPSRWRQRPSARRGAPVSRRTRAWHALKALCEWRGASHAPTMHAALTLTPLAHLRTEGARISPRGGVEKAARETLCCSVRAATRALVGTRGAPSPCARRAACQVSRWVRQGHEGVAHAHTRKRRAPTWQLGNELAGRKRVGASRASCGAQRSGSRAVISRVAFFWVMHGAPSKAGARSSVRWHRCGVASRARPRRRRCGGCGGARRTLRLSASRLAKSAARRLGDTAAAGGAMAAPRVARREGGALELKSCSQGSPFS